MANLDLFCVSTKKCTVCNRKKKTKKRTSYVARHIQNMSARLLAMINI